MINVQRGSRTGVFQPKAVGVMASPKSAVTPSSVRRPLTPTAIRTHSSKELGLSYQSDI